MDMEPKLFLDVPLASEEPNACSPKEPADWDWKGITINAPQKVWFKLEEKVRPYGAFVAVPICGYYMVEVRPDVADQNIILVAVDRATRATLSGPIIPLDPSPIVPPTLSTAKRGKDQGYVSRGIF